MSKEYHDKLIEAVGSSFYYYANHKEINLTRSTAEFEKFTKGWISEYQGNWEIFDNSAPIKYNIFKPCVDQLVYSVMDATEKEIERRVNEILAKHYPELDKQE